MSNSDEKEMVSYLEEKAIIARVDAIAESEGTTRSAIFRRAIRILLSSTPIVPISGSFPQAAKETAGK